MLPPPAVTELILLHTVRGGGGGGGAVKNAQKQNVKTYLELILHKPVGKYQFTMTCIRAFVMIVY